MDNFIVRFIRRDKKPNEEYYYHNRKDAEYHFSLFRNDDSGLYQEIILTQSSGDVETLLNKIKLN